MIQFIVNIHADELRKCLDVDLNYFIDSFLKLEIIEIKKYIINLIECLLETSKPYKELSIKVKQILSSTSLVSSLLSELSRKCLDCSINTKILGIFRDLIPFPLFYNVFRKQKGVEILIEHHSKAETEQEQTLIAQVFLEGLKCGIMVNCPSMGGFMEEIVVVMK